MVEIKRLHIHYRKLSNGKMAIKKVKPSDPTDKLALKHDVALAVRDYIQGKAEYYYVVVEIDKDGESAFRTITPKIVL